MTDAMTAEGEVAALLARLRTPVTRITSDSRQVRNGDAFAAYPGERTDGRSFIPDAIARGARSVLWEQEGAAWKPEWKVANAPVPGLKLRLGAIADVVYGHPSQFMWIVGVTGTNGKTSCAHWIAQGLHSVERRAAILGTLGNGLVGFLRPALNTTPDAALLHEMLAQLRSVGTEAVAMEVSSHGIDQGRVNGVLFEVALFTNLSRDHLDYHGSMAAYGAAKSRLMSWPGLRIAVINADDGFGRSLIDASHDKGRKIMSYGFGSADVCGSGLRCDARGISFAVRTPWGPGEVTSSLVGEFNASNLLAVLSVLLASGVSLEAALAFLRHVEAPAGRMQRLGGDGDAPLVVIDYAHTPDALEKVLTSLRPAVAEGAKLVCVFGCGGDRDPGKRPQMGAIAGRLADWVVITDDNPRSEDPVSIAAAIVDGVRESGNRDFRVLLERSEAIARAIRDARDGDVVLLAGKGHETYQERNGERQPFNDAEHAARALAERSTP